MWGAPVYGIWYGAGAISVGDWTFGGVSSSAIYNDGRWHFAVFVYDNAAVDGLKRKLYVDGVLVASDINAGTAIASVGAGGFLISNGTMGYFTGQSSRAFVAPTAYTADEISALYAVGSLSLGASPKNAGDHVERIDVTNLYLICDKFDSQDQIDIQVAS